MLAHRPFVVRLYLFTLFYELVFAYPIYAILFQARGLDLLQISLLLMWWSLSAGLFELPSGALADHWSRRNLLVLAPLVKLACFVTWFLADGNFLIFALGFTFWSLGGSFQSGTFEAVLYDGLAALGRTDEYEKIRGRQCVFHHVGCGVACVSGGFIAHYSLDWACLLSVVPLAAAVAVAATIHDPPRVRHVPEASYFAHFRNLWRELRTNGTFRYVLAYQMLVVGVLGDMDEYDPLYYTLVGVPLYVVGWLQLTRFVVESAGNLMAHRLKHVTAIERMAPLLVGTMLVLVGAFPCRPMILLIIASYLLLAPVEIIIEGKLQHSIQTNSRATVLSGAALMNMISGLPLLVTFGLVSKHWGLGAGYVLFGVILLAFWIWSARRSR